MVRTTLVEPGVELSGIRRRISADFCGWLAYDPDSALLYAVNAGSNTVSVFSAHGDDLSLRQVVGSGGVFPVSVAVHGNLMFYVLNALNGGGVRAL